MPAQRVALPRRGLRPTGPLRVVGAVVGAGVAAGVRAVGENPVTMALWAAIIMVLTFLSMATFMLGFAITIPVIGHATWHVYRDVVDASALPRRT